MPWEVPNFTHKSPSKSNTYPYRIYKHRKSFQRQQFPSQINVCDQNETLLCMSLCTTILQAHRSQHAKRALLLTSATSAHKVNTNHFLNLQT